MERPTSAIINFPVFMVHVGRRFEGVPMRPCGDPSGGIVLQMVPSNSFLNHMLIPWVSEVIYYCIYFEFGIICMFLTSFYAHFCILCGQLVG